MRSPSRRFAVLLSLLVACAAPEDASDPVHDVDTSSSAVSLPPSTSSVADAVDARCATAFTTTDREAIEAAIRTSPLGSADRITHALNRLGFGDRFAGTPLPTDPAATLANQIFASLKAGASIPSAARTAMAAALPTLARPSGDVHYEFRQLYVDRDAARAAGDATTAARLDAEIVAMRDRILDELASKQIMAAVLSPDIALGEHLTAFWLNHFNVEGREVAIWAPSYEWSVRTNVCGTFEGLLKEIARTPAMLKYLDLYASVAPGVTHWSGATGLNENYARELLELHTLGVGPRTTTSTGSPYTQSDVVQVARTLTGWSYSYATDQRSTSFKFFSQYHVTGSKTVMGTTYAEGEGGGLALLTNLANHARTKRFVCGKLAGHFFTATAPSAVVDACVAAWGTGGRLPRMITAILARPETWGAANFANKVKNPFELVVSSHRLSGDDEKTLSAGRAKSAWLAARRMGLWLWRVEPPTGYTTKHLDWLDAGYLAEQVRYVYGQSDPAGLELTTSTGTLTGAALENHFASLGNTSPSNALATARTKVLPLRGIAFDGRYDDAFLQTAFTNPDLAPGTAAPERPLRTLLTFYAASWQFLLK